MAAYGTTDNWGYDEVSDKEVNPFASPLGDSQYNLVENDEHPNPKTKSSKSISIPITNTNTNTNTNTTNNINMKNVNNNNNTNTNTNTNNNRNTYTGNAPYTKEGENITDRLYGIEQREKNALILEKELEAREKRMRDLQGKKNYRPIKNWPHPFIGWARNAISIDIPQQYQNDVRKFYALWLLTAIAAILNLLLCIWYGFSDEGSGEIGFMQWVVAFCYVILGLPGSWMWWYKRYYRAVQLNQQIPTLFFIFLTLHSLWAAIMALGLTLTGSFGFLVMGKCFTEGYDSIAVAMMINGALWSLVCALSIILLKVAHNTLGRFLAIRYITQEQQKHTSSSSNVGQWNVPDTWNGGGVN